MSSQTLILLLVVVLSNLNSISCLEFVFNTNFNSTNIHTYGNATIENSIVSITNQTVFTIGRALYPSKITTKQTNSTNPLPFSTSFIFSISTYKNLLPGHGLAFAFFPFDDANVRPTMRQVLKVLEGTGLEEEILNVNLVERIETALNLSACYESNIEALVIYEVRKIMEVSERKFFLGGSMV
ncbi:hypothetical protein QYF36_010997 [Acer negundo]|nr:hypothetical protein QYF36_010997 [Acer negundo]